MKRKRVTRTLKTYVVTALFFNENAEKTETKTFEVPYKVKNDEFSLKKLRRTNEFPNGLTLVKIKGIEVKGTCFGMDETEFIKNATILDNESRKPIEVEKQTKKVRKK